MSIAFKPEQVQPLDVFRGYGGSRETMYSMILTKEDAARVVVMWRQLGWDDASGRPSEARFCSGQPCLGKDL